MHIMIVSHYALPHMGGIEVVVRQLSQRLGARGHSVTHLSSSIGSSSGVTRTANVTHVGLPAINPLEKYAIPFPIFNLPVLLKTLDQVLPDIDVINVQGMLYMDCAIAAWIGYRRNIPVVVTEYPGFVNYKNPLVNLIEKLAFHTLGRFCCEHSDAATYINEQVARQWIKPFLRPNTTLVKIPIGVDTTVFTPADPAQKRVLREKWGFRKPTVLFVGRLVYRKGIDLLPGIACEEFDVVVCGHGALKQTAPGLRIVGHVEQSELVELYQAADLFMLLTDGQDFPLVGLEAISSGLPVIAIDTQANREYFDDRVALFTKREAKDISKAIRDLIADPARLSKMRAAARHSATSYYDWERSVDQYTELFQQLLNLQNRAISHSG
jgi:glycosyltransferase involved in cell wall biosynthesis